MSSPSILLVDDSETIRSILKVYLMNFRCSVLEAEHGEDAWATVQREPVKLIIADINMPGLDGISFLSRLRASGGTEREVPVVFLTAEKADEVRTRAVAAGADDFLQKPVGIRDLHGIVRRFLPGV